MTPLTPTRALRLLTVGLVCLMTATGAIVGALLGGAIVASVAAAGTGTAGLIGSLLARRRALAGFAEARREAGLRGYGEGIAHGVLLHTTVYEAAVFPRSAPAPLRAAAPAVDEARTHPRPPRRHGGPARLASPGWRADRTGVYGR